MSWLVIAHRGDGSAYGRADAPLREDGAYVSYPDRDAAIEEMNALNAGKTGVNMHFTVMTAEEFAARRCAFCGERFDDHGDGHAFALPERCD